MAMLPQVSGFFGCRWLTGVLSTLVLLLGVAALGQDAGLRMDVQEGAIGLDGYVRPGAWTPIRLRVDNHSADDREVAFTWEHLDEDGDVVLAERRVTLTRQRDDQTVWLYAAVPNTTSRDNAWVLRAVDVQSGDLLDSITVQPNAERLMTDAPTMLAVSSNADLGLNDYLRHETQHAPLTLVRGISLERLPDRWQGLSSLQTFIWTQDLGGDPADPLQVSESAIASMREWVYRGGHLVVVMPSVGQTWTASPLSDILPVSADQVRQRESDNWWENPWMGGVAVNDPAPMTVTTFRVEDNDPRASVLLRDRDDRPVVVVGRYGFGRVTLVGIDLTRPEVRGKGYPFGRQRLWNHVFGWLGQVMPKARADEDIRQGFLTPASRLGTKQLGAFIGGQITMTGTVGALLVGALLLFVGYWVLAGWLLQPILKRKNQQRWSWVAFLGVVAGCALLAWGGAWLLRPSKTSLTHVTVLDIDGNSGVSRGRSFLSFFVPRFGTSEVSLDSSRIAELPGDVHNLIASPGFSGSGVEVAFIDPQTYRVDSAAPDTVDVPMRATSKQMLVDYLGHLDQEVPGNPQPFSMASSQSLTADPVSGLPVGEVSHTLPGALTNVVVVVCPGFRADEFGVGRVLEPWAWRYRNPATGDAWEPGTPLALTGKLPTDPTTGVSKLFVRDPVMFYRPGRKLKEEGYLGAIMDQEDGLLDEVGGGVDAATMVRRFLLLSFFDALPPPEVARDPQQGIFQTKLTFQRRIGQRLDLTPMIHGRRVIVIGHLTDAPLPVPLTIDGEVPPSSGTTVVRWVYDF